MSSPTTADPTADVEGGSTVSVPDELPPPDPSTYVGANRVVNLWVGPTGEERPIDVWGRRTFTNGPILLAENVGFGETTDYLAAPEAYDLVIVNAGAGPDGVERAVVPNASVGEQITTVFTNGEEADEVRALDLFERGDPSAPEDAPPDAGVVWLVAPNTTSFSEDLIASVGGDAFYVGDGSAVCRAQRSSGGVEPADVLGGTQDVELELEPGAATVSLHPWFSPEGCDQPAVLDFEVDVVAGVTVLVVVFTPDGERLDTLTLPVASP